MIMSHEDHSNCVCMFERSSSMEQKFCDFVLRSNYLFNAHVVEVNTPNISADEQRTCFCFILPPEKYFPTI